MGRLSRVPPARAVRSAPKEGARPHLKAVFIKRHSWEERVWVWMDELEQARVAMGMEPKACYNCKHWVTNCRKSSYWICWGLEGHPNIYPPPGWEQK